VAPSLFAVTAGPYASLEEAAPEIHRLRTSGLTIELERRGPQFLVVLLRGATRSAAEATREQARRAGVRAVLEPQ
jgi:hypothetical protein